MWWPRLSHRQGCPTTWSEKFHEQELLGLNKMVLFKKIYSLLKQIIFLIWNKERFQCILLHFLIAAKVSNGNAFVITRVKSAAVPLNKTQFTLNWFNELSTISIFFCWFYLSVVYFLSPHHKLLDYMYAIYPKSKLLALWF